MSRTRQTTRSDYLSEEWIEAASDEELSAARRAILTKLETLDSRAESRR
ncbi:MAG: hypothetical protein QNL12_02160 [Acidimicrobiia bacterium]|nr:hypothetical protein [Acidimicrobiia bacterium]